MLSTPLLVPLRASSSTVSNAQTRVCIRRAITRRAGTVQGADILAQRHYRFLSTQHSLRQETALNHKSLNASSERTIEKYPQDLTLSIKQTPPSQETESYQSTRALWDILIPRVPEFEVVADTLALRNFQTVSLINLEQYPLSPVLRRLFVSLKIIQLNWQRVEAEGSISVPLLSDSEWVALSKFCIEVGDARLAETVLSLMKHSGFPPSSEQYNAILSIFVSRGQITEAEAHVTRVSSKRRSEHQCHSLIKVRLRAGEIKEASKLLRQYEEQGFPLSMESYSCIIEALLADPRSTLKTAEAWRLFTHMRETTNHTPDAHLYRTMLGRARPGPQTALDLLRETTIHGITRDHSMYAGAIRACASSRQFALHAVRLTHELVQAYHEASGAARERLQPNYYIFASAMEAATNSGNLSLVRSVLRVMEQYALETGSLSDSYAQIAVRYMFKGYSAYVPPSTVAVTMEPEKLGQQSTNASVTTQENSHLPQSHEEVLREAELIWERITAPLWKRDMSDTKPDAMSSLTSLCVFPDAQLVNAYMSVHYHHSSPSRSFEVFKRVSKSTGLRFDAQLCVLALEAFTNYKCNDENETLPVLTIVHKLWEHWKSLKESRIQYTGDPTSRDKNIRLAARAYMAMIRNLTNTRKFGEAEDLLRAFVHFSPPGSQPDVSQAKNQPERPGQAQTRSSGSPSQMPQGYIPYPRFSDIAGLRQHALETQNKPLFDFITWVIDSYLRRNFSTIRSAHLRKFHGSKQYP